MMDFNTMLIRAAVGFVALSILFFLIERVAARGRNRAQPIVRRGWATDVVYWFVTIPITKPLVRLALLVPIGLLVVLGLTSVDALKAGTYAGFGPVARQPVWLQAIEIYLLGDFLGYWTHRLFHRRGWWPFHAVHHSSEDLDWLGSLRVHPVNDLVNKLTHVSPILLLGFNPLVTLSSAPILTLHAIFLHANVNWDFGPLRYVISSPVFHRWHHSKERAAWDKNFSGLLPVWDILFGTFYMPRGRVPENFGIGDPMPEGYLGQLRAPFAWVLRRRKQVTPS